MTPIRTLIVDDEELCRRGIRILLEENSDFELIGECANGRSAIRKINEERPDLVFLDIQMPEISGFDVLERIDPERLPHVVFVTAYDEFAVKAFDVHALDYILKPFSKARFSKALARARESIESRSIADLGRSLADLMRDVRTRGRLGGEPSGADAPEVLQRILIRTQDGLKFVEVNEIDWVEGTDYYVTLHCGSRAYLYRETLKSLAGKLPSMDFVRVHKSAIVNLTKAERISTESRSDLYIVLKSGQSVKVSRRRRKTLLDLFEERFGLKSG